MDARIAKVDEERRLVFGWSSMAIAKDGTPVVDGEGDVIEPRELEDAAYEFVLSSREANVAHAGPTVARLVESFVPTPDKLAALGLAEDALPLGWLTTWYVDDDQTWEQIKNGDLAAFSIEGTAERVAA